MKRTCVVITFFFLSVFYSPYTVIAEPYLNVDLKMNNIENIEGSYSKPLPVIYHALTRISADDDNDWHVSSSEANSFLEEIEEDYKINLSMDDESLKREIHESFIMDFEPPKEIFINHVSLTGLTGDINQSLQPVTIVFSFSAIFYVEKGSEHSISIEINDSFSDDVKLSFKAPEGWEIGEVKGLNDKSFDDNSVEGIPKGQIDIKLIEGTNPLFMALCFLTVLVVVIIAVLVVITLTRKREQLSQRLMFWHSGSSVRGVETESENSTKVASGPSPQYPPDRCRHCGGALMYVEKYDRYYCNNCKILL